MSALRICYGVIVGAIPAVIVGALVGAAIA